MQGTHKSKKSSKYRCLKISNFSFVIDEKKKVHRLLRHTSRFRLLIRYVIQVFQRPALALRPEQAGQQVGYLAGLPGFAEQVCTEPEAGAEEQTGEQTGEQMEGPQKEPLAIPERMLVFCGFTERGIGELLSQFRRAKLPPVPMKAVLTEHNSGWSFYRLYQELRLEHEAMSAGKTAEHRKGGECE